MPDTYVHHSITTEPHGWSAAAKALTGAGADRLSAAGGSLFGIWRSQIGLPRDELTAISRWEHAEAAQGATEVLVEGIDGIVTTSAERLVPTLRPGDAAAPPRRQGNYAFRWFETKDENWDEFLALCEAAWPGFEAAYDSEVIGLWRVLDSSSTIRSLLLTRRPDLSMWERSKIPANEEEAKVRRKLSRRYDLAEWTRVYTTTLLTAEDREDTVRWT